ncbi:short transient receptor potential channel 2 [Osmerus eperlanus]|uniref:short transient receptor potential channel 2 n=1 Tax=Osmerus eperlanus TaxID=29151 RepID=UPI002E12EBC3
MAPVKIKHVVSFTSQDPKSTVGNLFGEDAGTRSWLCNPQDHSGVLKAELQLEHITCIRYIDVGNCGSAFIQIDVGRSSWSLDHPYTTLLPTTTLMSPAESRQGSVRTGVRMFKKGDFLSEGAEDSWDRVRVTCSQPFNRRSQFGLSFLRIRSAQGENDCVPTQQKALEGLSPGVGQWLSSPAVQKTFFREKSRKDFPMASVGLSRTARMVLSAASRHPAPKSLSNAPSSPPNTRTSPSAKADTSTPSTAEEDVLTSNIHPHTASKACLFSALSPKDNNNLRQPKSKKNSNTRCDQLNETPCSKQRRPASRRSPSPVSTAMLPAHSPAVDIETTCPICGEMFTAEYLPLHASSCQETDAVHPGIASSLPLSPDPPSSPEDMFPCPLCSFRFPASRIQLHASTCEELSPFIWLD